MLPQAPSQGDAEPRSRPGAGTCSKASSLFLLPAWRGGEKQVCGVGEANAAPLLDTAGTTAELQALRPAGA